MEEQTALYTQEREDIAGMGTLVRK